MDGVSYADGISVVLPHDVVRVNKRRDPSNPELQKVLIMQS